MFRISKRALPKIITWEDDNNKDPKNYGGDVVRTRGLNLMYVPCTMRRPVEIEF